MEYRTDIKRISCLAIDKYVESNIVTAEEREVSGQNYVSWGRRNDYPRYLADLVRNVTTLKSIIEGSMDYVAGDEVTLAAGVLDMDDNVVNKRGDTAQELVRRLAHDYFAFGGFAIEVIRNNTGKVAELYHVGMQYLRSNPRGDVFYYNEKFGESCSGRARKTIIRPAFMANAPKVAASILYVKNDITGVYPTPLYAAAVKACEIERCADNFHLNAINNAFTGSYIINFNNGVPEDEIRAEIERDFNEKFSGASNAGRIMFSWNDTKDNALTTERVQVDDFGEKYQSLAKHSRQQIFTAFRANPNLFGIPTENLGFSQEEYESAFKLYNRTQIKPVQKKIVDAVDRILGRGSMVITPFTLEGVDTNVTND